MKSDDVERMKSAISSLCDLVRRCSETVQETQLIRELINKVIVDSRTGLIGETRTLRTTRSCDSVAAAPKRKGRKA